LGVITMANSSPDLSAATIPTQPVDSDNRVVDLREDSVQLRTVKHHRSQLKRAMIDLEAVLARPIGDDPRIWLAAVRRRLADLQQAFDNHIHVHEGPDSFHADVVQSQPHLAPHVVSLQRDHHRLSIHLLSLSELLEHHPAPEVHDIRALGTDLIHQFARHRQRGADLVWEAFNFDVGGEH
jgi:hypothetical protein